MQQFFLADPSGAALLIFLAIMVGVAIERWRAKLARKEWQKKRQGKTSRFKTWPNRPNLATVKSIPEASTPTTDPAEQLRLVMAANFTKRSLLNQSELRVFTALEREMVQANCEWRLMAQVSLGEILGSDDKAAYWAINAKRVDFLVIDDNGMPLHAIEYQGGGHYQDTAAARDATKKEALRKAGIGYHEVIKGDRLDDLRQLLTKLIRS